METLTDQNCDESLYFDSDEQFLNPTPPSPLNMIESENQKSVFKESVFQQFVPPQPPLLIPSPTLDGQIIKIDDHEQVEFNYLGDEEWSDPNFHLVNFSCSNFEWQPPFLTNPTHSFLADIPQHSEVGESSGSIQSQLPDYIGESTMSVSESREYLACYEVGESSGSIQSTLADYVGESTMSVSESREYLACYEVGESSGSIQSQLPDYIGESTVSVSESRECLACYEVGESSGSTQSQLPNNIGESTMSVSESREYLAYYLGMAETDIPDTLLPLALPSRRRAETSTSLSEMSMILVPDTPPATTSISTSNISETTMIPAPVISPLSYSSSDYPNDLFAPASNNIRNPIVPFDGGSRAIIERSRFAIQREKTANMGMPELSPYLHIPMEEAAKRLNICTSALKRIHKRVGLPRWPSRKIKAIDGQIDKLQCDLDRGNRPGGVSAIRERIEALQRERAEFYMEH